MIPWVNQLCKDWGRAQHWIWFGGVGLPPRTMLGKLIEEGVVGAAFSSFTMQYPEVLTGDNLLVANAVKTLPETPRTVITVHYVLHVPTKLKYSKLKMTRHSYYATLSAAHINLANAIDAQERKSDKMERDRPEKSMGRMLCLA